MYAPLIHFHNILPYSFGAFKTPFAVQFCCTLYFYYYYYYMNFVYIAFKTIRH